MTVRIEHVTFDCADPRALAQWWADAVGSSIQNDWDDFVVVAATPSGLPPLGFQRVPEGKAAKNRVHLDLLVEDAGEIDLLVARGATVLAEHSAGPISWTVLTDPAGNEFCARKP